MRKNVISDMKQITIGTTKVNVNLDNYYNIDTLNPSKAIMNSVIFTGLLLVSEGIVGQIAVNCSNTKYAGILGFVIGSIIPAVAIGYIYEGNNDALLKSYIIHIDLLLIA
jgi:hypothetical protein